MRVERKEYFNKLISYMDKKIIKVITGVRRCGKSTLLEMFTDYLRNNGISENQIIFLNFDDLDNSDLCDADALYKYIKARIHKNKMLYVILDEIQMVPEFQKVINSCFLKDNIDIYITGSNSYMLSGELATLLTGRYIEIFMLPLSFKEFTTAIGLKENPEESYRKYIEQSSFPFTLNLEGNNAQIRDYLDSLYNTIVIKDITNRKKISDTLMLESVLKFAVDNVGNQLSNKKISDTMTSNGRKISSATVESYLSAFLESFVLFRAGRYDIKGKEHLKTLEKYYVVDAGFRKTLLGSSANADVGHVLENVIYLELLRRGYKVYVGKIDSLEVDFIAMNDKTIKYIQVSASVRDESVLERELKPLKMIKDSYSKCILTLDKDPQADFNGISRINALEWLMGVSEF